MVRLEQRMIMAARATAAQRWAMSMLGKGLLLDIQIGIPKAKVTHMERRIEDAWKSKIATR